MHTYNLFKPISHGKTNPTKTDLDSFVFLHKNPIFMSVWVHPGCSDTKWYHHDPYRHKDGIFTQKYGAVQVYFGEVVLLCLLSAYNLKFVVYRLKWLVSLTANFFEVALAKMDKLYCTWWQ